MVKNERVLSSFGKHGKRTLIGLRSLWQDGPKIIPYIKTFYQQRPPLLLKEEKGAYHFEAKRPDDDVLIFNPSDYEAHSIQEAKRSAFKDASHHKKFYQHLIKEGIYPEGTRVSVRKAKHSDRFVIELKVPKLKEFTNYLWRVSRDKTVSSVEIRNLIERQKSMGYRIDNEAHKWGHRCYDPANPLGREINSDVFEQFNYGVDKDDEIRYFDKHVLQLKLPFKGRKKSKLETQLEKYASIYEEGNVNKIVPSSRTVVQVVITVLLIGSFCFLSPIFTGNVISDLSIKTTSFIGMVLLIIGLIAGFLWFKFRKLHR